MHTNFVSAEIEEKDNAVQARIDELEGKNPYVNQNLKTIRLV